MNSECASHSEVKVSRILVKSSLLVVSMVTSKQLIPCDSKFNFVRNRTFLL